MRPDLLAVDWLNRLPEVRWGRMTGKPIFGGWRERRLSQRQLDALLRKYDCCLEPAPPIRWPRLAWLKVWWRTEVAG